MKGSNKKYITIFGIKIGDDVIVMLIIFLIGLLMYCEKTYKLNHGKTVVVYAKIIDVGTMNRPGIGIHRIGYIKFGYHINGKYVIKSSSSFQIMHNLEQYHVGDCIELLIKPKDENCWEWNKSKGTFKCN